MSETHTKHDMLRSEVGEEAIQHSFKVRAGVKVFISRRPTPRQEECVFLLEKHVDEIFRNRSRDLYLKTLVTCVTGYSDEDEEEPITEAAFSQSSFYETYVQALVYYPDKFDFLVHCILNCVCLVATHHIPKFKQLVDGLLQKESKRTIPDAVLEYDQLLDADDEKRIESFTMRKDWKSQVPEYTELVDRILADPSAYGEVATLPL